MWTLEDMFNDIKNGASLERIHKKYSGFSFYVTAQVPNYKEKIQEEFTGYNYDALAHKYNVTPQTVREVLRQNAPKEKGLFDED